MRTGLLAIAVLPALLAGAAGTALDAQEPDEDRGPGDEAPGDTTEVCPDGRIGYIYVDNKDIFDVDELSEDRRFAWAYDLANTLHVRTSEDFIRDELLFGTGDCYDPFLLEETERLLRDYGFISRVDVFGLLQADGSWHVIVDTQDEWTTKVNLGVDFRGGFGFKNVELTEENLLGEGILAGVFYREDDEQRDAGARLRLPQLFGTRVDASLSGGRTRVGRFLEQEFFYPFVGEVGRVAGRQLYRRRESLFPYSVGGPGVDDEGEVTHVLLPVEEERFEITLAGRVGEPGNLTVFGLGFSNETLEFPGFPGNVEVARDRDFGNTEPAGEELAGQILSQTRHSAATRVNLLVGQRNIHYGQFTGLDALRGVQDVPLGTDVNVTLGRSLALLSSGEDQPDDLYTRIRIFLGSAPGDFLAAAAVGVEGRQVFSGGATSDGWKDVLAELDAFLYWQPRGADAHTVLLKVAGAGGWSLTMPYQLTLGGREGVRGYHERAFAGARRGVVTLEDRIYLGWPFPELFDLGITVFADAGRVWAGEVPFGNDSGWRGTVGGGLRVGFPAGTRGVVRLDAAVPVGPDGGFSRTIFRVSVTDLVGLVDGFEDDQLRRSRRNTVGSDFFVTRSAR